jgi:hypothetical protein
MNPAAGVILLRPVLGFGRFWGFVIQAPGCRLWGTMKIEIRVISAKDPAAAEVYSWPVDAPLVLPNVGDSIETIRFGPCAVRERGFTYSGTVGNEIEQLVVALFCS